MTYTAFQSPRPVMDTIYERADQHENQIGLNFAEYFRTAPSTLNNVQLLKKKCNFSYYIQCPIQYEMLQ